MPLATARNVENRVRTLLRHWKAANYEAEGQSGVDNQEVPEIQVLCTNALELKEAAAAHAAERTADAQNLQRALTEQGQAFRAAALGNVIVTPIRRDRGRLDSDSSNSTPGSSAKKRRVDADEEFVKCIQQTTEFNAQQLAFQREQLAHEKEKWEFEKEERKAAMQQNKMMFEFIMQQQKK
jgi:hypothetical protein